MQFRAHLGQHPSPPPDFVYAPPSDELTVLHVDEHLLVVEKPPGLLSVPGKGADLADCVESRAQSLLPEARIVHRLDMDTSGVMVLARTAQAHRHLGLQFERRHTSKTYEALVKGPVGANAGTIDLPLRCDWPNRPKQMVCFEHGRRSITHWRVLDRSGGTTRLELKPVTGRSHQLRVHLMACGHPILGDSFYGTPGERLCLHSSTLSIRHPADGSHVTFTSPVPF
ncbi:MAG: RluA family pseudouridine synthase [Pseudomonadota bacterium]